MNEIEALFSSIIGQYAWAVCHEPNMSISIEFGVPRLIVINPRKAQTDVSEEVKKRFARRKVFPKGQWSFFTVLGECEVIVEDKKYTSSELANEVGNILNIISGQKLVASHFEIEKKLLTLNFDLGGVVRIYPPNNIKDTEAGLWCLSVYHGDDKEEYIRFGSDGVVIKHT